MLTSQGELESKGFYRVSVELTHGRTEYHDMVMKRGQEIYQFFACGIWDRYFVIHGQYIPDWYFSDYGIGSCWINTVIKNTKSM
jgi:hypothetical protein